MKKFLSILLLLAILLPTVSGEVTLAATKTSLTTRETAIAKAYIKSYESGNLTGIKSYTYPGVKLTVDAVSSTTNVKVFFPEYTKKYDSKSKMNCILISCIVAVSDGTKLTVSKGTMGINLKTKDKTTYVYSKNTAIAKLNEIAVSDITETQVKDIQTYLTGIYGETLASKMLFGSPKALTATFDSPVALGSTYTYNTAYSRKGDTLSGTFSITINSYKDLTDDDLKNMGYVKNKYEVERDEYWDQKLVNITWEAKDVKIVKLASDNEKGYVYKRYIIPIFAGNVNPEDSNEYLNIVQYDGFTDSFQSKLNDEFKWSYLKLDSTANVEITGNVIMPVYIGFNEVYMRFVQPGVESFNEYMYFKTK